MLIVMRTSSDLTATLSKTAAKTAAQIDGEWQKLLASIEKSESVPGQVKQAARGLDSMVGTVRGDGDATTAGTDAAQGFVDASVDDAADAVSDASPAGEAASGEGRPSLDPTQVVGVMKEFVGQVRPTVADASRRAARQLGVTVPDSWPWSPADEAAETVADAAETAGDTVADAAETAGDTVADAAETAGDTVADAAETAGDTVADAAETAGDTVATAGDTVATAGDVATQPIGSDADAANGPTPDGSTIS